MSENHLSNLSEHYLVALRNHLGQSPPADFQTAHGMGSEALSMGLETLDLAVVHDKALARLLPRGVSSLDDRDMIARAAAFFTESITPIERTHRVAMEAIADLNQLNETLHLRILDLEDSHRELQHEITVRESSEVALKSSELASSRLLMESRLLERQLQDMAQKILISQEIEKKKMSLQLHDEIAQTLLGIHVRLLTLKEEALANHTDLAKEIANTQRLVEQSVNTINRLAREFGTPHQK